MKQIYKMSIDEMVSELRSFCSTKRNCKHCELSLVSRLGDGDVGHTPFVQITDRHTLSLMLAIARGYLVWQSAKIDPNDPEADYFNIPDQPMPELAESIKSSIEETLTAELPEDSTVLVLSGKKPTSVTVYYDREGG